LVASMFNTGQVVTVVECVEQTILVYLLLADGSVGRAERT
jgi:hypothetical protein